jgi:hypothetical protein
MQSHSFRSIGKVLLAATCAAGLGVASLQAQTAAPSAPAPNGVNPSKADIFLGYSFYGPHGTNKPSELKFSAIPAGAIGSFAYYFSRNIGGEVVYVNYPDGSNDGYSGLTAGPIFRLPMDDMTLFGHGLVGYGRLGGPNVPSEDSGCGPYCYHNPYRFGPSLTAGGGLDYNIHKWNDRIGYRLFQLDYNFYHGNWGPPVAPPTGGAIGGRANINGVELSTGLLIHMGNITPPPPVTYSCVASPASAFPGDPVTITGTATNLNPKKTATYSWSSDAGAVSGTSNVGNLNTATLNPGTYTVKGHVAEGQKPGQMADCSAQVTVRAYEPPTVSCSANPTTVRPGDSSTITVTAASPQNRPLTYSYNATAGSINGTTSSAMLSTTGAAPGTITVTCNVQDDKGNTASGRTSVDVQAPPPPPPPPPPPAPQVQNLCTMNFARDTHRPTRVDNEAKACLDDVSLNLQRDPNAKLAIAGNAHAGKSRAAQRRAEREAAARAVNAKAYLVKEKGIDASRVMVYTGSSDDNTAATTLVPSGASLNTGGLTPVDEAKVKPNAAAARTHATRKK